MDYCGIVEYHASRDVESWNRGIVKYSLVLNLVECYVARGSRLAYQGLPMDRHQKSGKAEIAGPRKINT